MKRSTQVTLTVVAAMGLTSCSRRYDPCEARYFDSVACADAVRGGGYYWRGSWYPMSYHYPYPYYYDSYQRHVSTGGRVYTAPSGAYGRPATGAGKQFGTGGSGSSSSPAASGTTRGGFGSTGSGSS